MVIKLLWRRCNTICLAVAYIFIATFLIILPLTLGDWSYSWYFSNSWTQDKMIQQANVINLQRLRQAQAYLSSFNPRDVLNEHKIYEDKTGLELAVGVVSVKRVHSDYELGYLIQVMAHLDKLFREDKLFQNKIMYVCNTDSGPGEHVEAEDLSRYFIYRKRFKQNDPSETILDPFEKEKRDYVYCLQQALQWNPKYIVILEDDALPKPNFLPVLYNLLTRIEAKDSNWSFLKLYYPERWQGYSFKLRHALEICILTLLGVWFAVIVSKILCLEIFIKSRKTLLLVASLYFFLLFTAIGRPYLIKWRNLSPVVHSLIQAEKCCTPGMVYHRDLVRDILQHLNKTTCSPYQPIDKVLDHFSVSKNYEMYLSEPNLINHIGLFSTIKGGAKFPEEFL